MGQMIAGKWVTDAALGSVTANGDWKRTPSVMRNWVGGEKTTLPPTTGRYHLYAAWIGPVTV